MKSLFRNIFSVLALCGLTATAAAQTAPTTAKPNTLVPDGTTPGGVTRLRLLADPVTPAPSAPSATATIPAPPAPLPPLPAPSGTATLPPNVPLVPPGAIPPNAGDSSYPPREPMRRAPSQPKTSDPTVPGPAIRELLGQGDKAAAQTPQASPGLPMVRLRGRVAVRNKPVAAIIEIDGRMYSVRAGDEFSVNTDGGAPTPMKVLKLTATEMQIELVNRRLTVNLN